MMHNHALDKGDHILGDVGGEVDFLATTPRTIRT